MLRASRSTLRETQAAISASRQRAQFISTSRCLREHRSTEPDKKSTPSPTPLQRWAQQQNNAFRSSWDSLSNAASTKFALLGGKINTISGYEDIEALKTRVSECGEVSSNLCSNHI